VIDDVSVVFAKMGVGKIELVARCSQEHTSKIMKAGRLPSFIGHASS